MAQNLYLSVDRLKGELDAVSTTWTAAETVQLSELCEAVSRAIDDYCGRRFYQTASGVARYFTSDSSSELVIDDLVSIDTNGLTTDISGNYTYGRTWATTDYVLAPFNASEFDMPYTYIELAQHGRYAFPTWSKGVKITGTWGFPAVPRAIRAACSLECRRAWQQLQSPSGVVTSDVLGTFMVEPEWHRKSLALLKPYRRTFLVGAS